MKTDKETRKSNILVLGISGMLGHTLFNKLLRYELFNVYGTSRSILPNKAWFTDPSKILSNIDAFNYNSVKQALESIKPDVVINCIGLVKQLPVACDPVSAITINALFPHKLAQLCKERGVRLIHISTDCVFDGSKGNYRETDIPNATDLYGRTKLLGEIDYSHCITLRTSIIGHELCSQHGLIEWFLAQQNRVNGFTKTIFSGLPTVKLAEILAEHVIPNEKLSGVYHISADAISKYDLLSLVAEQYDKQIEIIPDNTVVCNRSLNSDRFRNVTGYHPPVWPTLIKCMHADWIKFNYSDKKQEPDL